jgi:hypothetical protein
VNPHDRVRRWRWAGILGFGWACTGCAPAKGGAGQPCKEEASEYFGVRRLRCKYGLACNDGYATPRCERANLGAAGTICGSDLNCAPGLFCAGKQCKAELDLSEPCPSGVGCRADLVCLKVQDGSARCGPAADVRNVETR